jgi:hypothetical protein
LKLRGFCRGQISKEDC